MAILGMARPACDVGVDCHRPGRDEPGREQEGRGVMGKEWDRK